MDNATFFILTSLVLFTWVTDVYLLQDTFSKNDKPHNVLRIY